MSPASTSNIESPTDLPAHLEVRRSLGREGNTRLYEARQLDFDRQIVLRVSDLKATTFGADKGRAEQVIARLRKLDHPGVCKLFGGGVQDAMVYLEAEPPRGRLLESFLKDRRLTDAQRISLALRVAEALAYLHGQGIGYGDLLSHGVRVARRLGTLELEPQLVRLETFRALKPDGSEQRAFGKFATSLAGDSTSHRTDLQERLAALGDECAATTSGSPTFANIVLRLREIADEQQQRSASAGYHCAEPAKVAALKWNRPKVSLGNNSRITYWVVIAAVILLGGFIKGLANRSNHGTNSSRSNTAHSRPFTPPRDSSFPPVERDTRRLTQSPQPHTRSYTLVPDSPRTRLPNLEGTRFAVPRTMPAAQSTTEGEVDEQYQLSNAKWEGNFGAPMEFSIDYAGPGESFAGAMRLLWIVESDDGERYRARLTGGLETSGTLRGNTAFLRDVRLPVQTYLAVEKFPHRSQPKRISNIVIIDSSTNK